MISSAVLRNGLAVVLLVATISAATASLYPPVCYSRSQQCCFNFHPCGTITKKVTKTIDCSFRKCHRVCRPRCRHVRKKVAFEKCRNVKTQNGQKCKKEHVYHHGKWIWKQVCHPTYVLKPVCVTKYRIVKKKVCRRKCRRRCKKVLATCTKIHVLSFPKFCPKLTCSKYVIKGDSTEPAFKVGTKSTLVKVIDGNRTISH